MTGKGRVANKVAIVTGGAMGLGRADAELLAQEGAMVVLTDVNAAEGEYVAKAIGRNALFVRQDVTDEQGWRELIDMVVGRFGKLDILVNNAGVVTPGDAETQTTADYRRIMSVSMDGVFFGCKYAIPAMRKSGGGSIVNMSSIAALVGESTVAAYCAAKGAVRAYTKAVAVHCAQQGYPIRCNSVHPSGMDTPMVKDFYAAYLALYPPDPGKPAAAGSRLGEPKDVAYAVLYLASDESKFTSGAELVVDNTITVRAGVVP
jgi:3(or 17)beta-hydroxysteroid dehydrogenase